MTAATAAESPGDLLDEIAWQPIAVKHLRAALDVPLPSYLFVGPEGSVLRHAAVCFAGELLAASSESPDEARRLALAEQHPDLLIFDRVGAALTADQARTAVREAALAPATGGLKVIVLPEVDRAGPIAPILLKSVEEPPDTCIFLLLAQEVNRSMETLASRCVSIEFEATSADDVEQILISEGASPSDAAFAVREANGSIDLARWLANSASAKAFFDSWKSLRRSLDGRGATAMVAADAALDSLDAATARIEARHEDERAEADEHAELTGVNTARRSLDERHRRELRRERTDQLNRGLGLISQQVRDDLAEGTLSAAAAAAQLRAVSDATEALRFNANQRLALGTLFIKLRHQG